MLQQTITMGSTALSGIIIARALPIEAFGLYSFMITLGGMGAVLLASGLSALAIRELIDHPRRQASIMTALIVVRELTACALYLIFLLTAFLSGGEATLLITAVGLVVLFARGFDATEYWFQSRVESGKTAPIRIVVVLAMLAARLAAWGAGASLELFVWLYVIEAVIITLGLFCRYMFAAESPHLASPQRAESVRLLKGSWPLFLADLARQVNLRGDVVLIQALLGSAALGIYSAAARLSEILYFLPVVLMTAVFPGLLALRRDPASKELYTTSVNRWFSRAFWAGAVAATIIYFLGPWVIVVLFGARYEDAGQVLQIHVLALPFVFMGAVLSKWLVAEHLLRFELIRNTAGALANIGLNLMLLPSLGIAGAAIASVISYAAASFLVPMLFRKTRPAAAGMLAAPFRPVMDGWRHVRKRHDR